nr:hypothetical protein HMPREF0276_1796 [Corynebacterium accolens ATCC 49725]
MTVERRPRAHPRSRGEHLALVLEESHESGSSPLTRGARRGFRRVFLGRGLIPAHAGSTGRVLAHG